MPKEKRLVVEGVITEVLSNTMFRVQVKERIILAYLSGKMRMKYRKLLPGEKVLVEISSYDLNKGRILQAITK